MVIFDVLSVAGDDVCSILPSHIVMLWLTTSTLASCKSHTVSFSTKCVCWTTTVRALTHYTRCRITSIILSHFILDLRYGSVEDTTNLSEQTSIAFATPPGIEGNLGAPLSTSNDLDEDDIWRSFSVISRAMIDDHNPSDKVAAPVSYFFVPYWMDRNHWVIILYQFRN